MARAVKAMIGALVALGLCGGAASAQTSPSPPAAAPAADAARPAIARLPARGGATLRVTSPAFADGGDIPHENTQYRSNTFPGLSWSAGPKGTRGYVVILQDPDLLIRGAPVLHWVLFNIPASVTALPPGMTERPAGSSYGPSYQGPAHAYLGPRTPPGRRDRYHFQVFAVDAPMPEAASGDFEALLAAMQDHVLASGETVGVGFRDPALPAAPAPAPRPAG
jgi:para-nitrobenzyl esterase